jgi:hypothetical protein
MSAVCHTLVMLLLLTGCAGQEIRPAATGPDGEVLVVIAPAHWQGAAGEAIRTALGSPIATLPTPEPLFDLRAVVLSETDRPRIEAHPQVVLVGALQDSTAEAAFLRARLAPAAAQVFQQGTGALVAQPAYWRTRQQVYFVMAASPDSLVSVLHQHGAVLREGFTRLSRERLSRAMYDRGRQTDLEQHLLAQHGFAVHVQHDYALVADTAGFVWLRRVLPDTWRSLFVYYEEAADATRLTPDWVRTTRERLGKQYLQSNAGGYVTPDPRRPDTLYPMSFLQYQGYEWRGLWQMVGADTTGRVVPLGMGGPFLAYAFYEATQRRLYLIEGMVFAPGFPKREFLRQMEAMASTFVTSAKPSP